MDFVISRCSNRLLKPRLWECACKRWPN